MYGNEAVCPQPACRGPIKALCGACEPLIHKLLCLIPQLIQQLVELCVMRAYAVVAELMQHGAQHMVPVIKGGLAAGRTQPNLHLLAPAGINADGCCSAAGVYDLLLLLLVLQLLLLVLSRWSCCCSLASTDVVNHPSNSLL
jgi:hypothetical protein